MRRSRQIWPVAIRRLNAEKMLTIASSEQEAAFTLVLPLETVSRCLLSLTQAFGFIARVDPLGSPFRGIVPVQFL